VEEAFKSLDLSRVFRIARRTREWGRMYPRQHRLFHYTEADKDTLGKFDTEAKTHRCVLDQDWAFCA